MGIGLMHGTVSADTHHRPWHVGAPINLIDQSLDDNQDFGDRCEVIVLPCGGLDDLSSGRSGFWLYEATVMRTHLQHRRHPGSTSYAVSTAFAIWCFALPSGAQPPRPPLEGPPIRYGEGDLLTDPRPLDPGRVGPPQLVVRAPQVTWFQIHGGATTTTARNVRLNSRATREPAQYRASEFPNFWGLDWTPYQPDPTFRLSEADGEKIVYLQLKGVGGESYVAADSIRLETPTGRQSFTVGFGDAYALANDYGFGFEAIGDASSNCEFIVGGNLKLHSFGKSIAGDLYATGSRCDFSLFQNRQLREGWRFTGCSMTTRDYDGSDTNHSVNRSPDAGGRDMLCEIHAWSNQGHVCELILSSLALEGPTS